jgi:CBS domain-containing protein
MTKDVVVIDPWMSILEVAQKMRDGDVGCLLIGENDRLVGVVTDRDIVTRGLAEVRSTATTPVRAVMSTGVLYCFEDQTMEEAARSMARHGVRRLAVLNRQKRLVGIVSLGDIAAAKDEAQEVANALGRISQHSKREIQIQA